LYSTLNINQAMAGTTNPNRMPESMESLLNIFFQKYDTPAFFNVFWKTD
jgi:hypothetical protein